MDSLSSPFDTADNLLHGGVANLPGGLFQGSYPNACQLRPFQFVKAEQANIAAPVETNALERAGNLQSQRAVSGDHRLAHTAMLLVELAQGVIELGVFRQRHFGVVCHHARIAGEGGAKGAQTLATGIDGAQRFTDKQQCFKALLDEMFGGSCRSLGVIQPHHVTGKIGNFSVDKHHR